MGRRFLVLVTAVALGAPVAAGAGVLRDWMTFYAPGGAVSIQLPPTWEAVVPSGSRHMILEVDQRDGLAKMAVIRGPVQAKSWEDFRVQIQRDIRVRELSSDPHASVRFRVVHLPAGSAVQTIAAFSGQRSRERVRTVYYDFWRNGMLWEVQYMCFARKSGVYVPVFDASILSLRIAS